MAGLSKRKLAVVDINEAYEDYLRRPDDVCIINADEIKYYDDRHIEGAENFPSRLAKDVEDYYPEKDMTYYVYSLIRGRGRSLANPMLKKGYDVYLMSDYRLFRGEEEGLAVKKKKRRKRGR